VAVPARIGAAVSLRRTQLIGQAALELGTVEQILSSGLLHGNERAIQGFRQVAATDVITKDGSQGRARELDAIISGRGIEAGQPQPAVRMATALYSYSLVPRAQAKRGATKPELLAAIYQPHGVSFHSAEETRPRCSSDTRARSSARRRSRCRWTCSPPSTSG
jgi:hypothetical protein